MIYRGRVVDVVWASGFLDGEGCFTITRGHGGRQLAPRITAAQTVEAPIDKLLEIFGGNKAAAVPPKNPRWRPSWRWEVYGATACKRVIPMVLPFLIVKRSEAELLLEFCERLSRANGGRGRRLSDEEYAVRCQYVERLSEMKHAV